MPRNNNWKSKLNSGLIFFGLKEEPFGSGDLDYEVDYREEAPYVGPARTEARLTPTQPVTVLGDSAPRASAPPIIRASDIDYRQATPPSGVVITSAPVTPTAAAVNSVELFVASKYLDGQPICDLLRQRRSVILNVSHLDESTRQKLLAFVCGYVYSLEGRMLSLVKGAVILAEPVRGVTTPAEIIERYRERGFEN